MLKEGAYQLQIGNYESTITTGSQIILDIRCAIYYHQSIMRTTVDIDEAILKDLKKIQQKEGRSLGRLISDLLAQALGERKSAKNPPRPRQWISKTMGARVDLEDHDALYSAMEQELRSDKGTQST